MQAARSAGRLARLDSMCCLNSAPFLVTPNRLVERRASARPLELKLGIAFSLLGTRSIPFELRYCWVKMVPRLSASHPNVRLGLEPTGIVEARGPHSKIFDPG